MAAEFEPVDAVNLLRSFTRHTAFVREGLGFVTAELERRGVVHDLSKMLDDEFGGFSRINEAARVSGFGTPAYDQGMKQERETINLHFSRNAHHPESASLNQNRGPMTFVDVIEMVCDWWGARKGYDNQMPWMDSVAFNLERKGKHLLPEQRWLALGVAQFLASKEVPK